MKIDIELKKEIDNSYQIHFGELPNLDFSGRKVAIISNPKVSGLHLKTLLSKLTADEVYFVTVPDDEEYKNMESVNLILESLFKHRLNRNSLLIGFGGGVIGDMTGFVASIFNRGIDFIQIPTTLLSQVDASVGGKTGINNSFGKNLIGAFHQPKAVYIDPNFLKTLPEREFASGVAEIVKMAVVFDSEFFSWLENVDLRNEKDLIEAIKKSVQLKAFVVSQDEKEKGARASLNYGHTFGHVIENETKYSEFLHGEAVAIGIIMANRVAEKLGNFSENESERVLKILQKYDLPTNYAISNSENFYQKFFLDKKSLDKKIKFVLPNGIGKYEFRDDISKETLISVLENFK
ncbi:3-dehydroquinate synthase [Thiovulum sp. ES]|nr:3-dehydroquinate synthase [Thiovulum sp. ES]